MKGSLNLKREAIRALKTESGVMSRVADDVEKLIRAEIPSELRPKGWEEKLAAVRQLHDHFTKLWLETVS